MKRAWMVFLLISAGSVHPAVAPVPPVCPAPLCVESSEPSVVAYRTGSTDRVAMSWIEWPFGGTCAQPPIHLRLASSSNMSTWNQVVLDPYNPPGVTPPPYPDSVTGDPFFAANEVSHEAYIVTESRQNKDWQGKNEISLWRGGADGQSWCPNGDCTNRISVCRQDHAPDPNVVLDSDKPSIAVGPAEAAAGDEMVYVAHILPDHRSNGVATRIHAHYRTAGTMSQNDWPFAEISAPNNTTVIHGPIVLVDPANRRVYVVWVDWSNQRIQVAELVTPATPPGAPKTLQAIGSYGLPAGTVFPSPLNSMVIPDTALHPASMPMASVNALDNSNGTNHSIGIVWHQWRESDQRMTVQFSRFYPPNSGGTNGTFGSPVQIGGPDGPKTAQWTPAIAVDDKGSYVVTYYNKLERKHPVFPSTYYPYEVRVAFIDRAGAPLFTPGFPLSNRFSDPDGGCLQTPGEYQSVSVSQGKFLAGFIQRTVMPNGYTTSNANVAAYRTSCTQPTTFRIDKASPMEGCARTRTPQFKVHPGARLHTSFLIWDNANNTVSPDGFDIEWSDGANVVGTAPVLDYTVNETTTLLVRVTSRADGTCDQIPVRVEVDPAAASTTGQENACGKMRSVRHDRQVPGTPGSPVYLSITPVLGETYRWYRTSAAVTNEYFATGPDVTDYPMTNTTYHVEPDDGVAFERIQVAQVTMCVPPAVTLPADRTITLGTSTSITGSATGDPTLQFQWYTLSGGVQTAIGGATSSTLDNAAPNQTTTYRLVATNNCGSGSDDIIVTVTGSPPSTPVMIGAVYNAATGYDEVSWQPSSSTAGISQYVIERMPDGQILTTAAQSTTIYDQSNVVAGRTYVYRVKAVDVNNVSSGYSARDLTTRTTFTDDPVRAPNDNGGTLIRGLHVSELRRAVDAVRAAAGLGAAWSDYSTPSGLAYASQFTELRDRLNEGRRVFLLPDVVFTDSVAVGQTIRGRSINELRNGVK